MLDKPLQISNDKSLAIKQLFEIFGNLEFIRNNPKKYISAICYKFIHYKTPDFFTNELTRNHGLAIKNSSNEEKIILGQAYVSFSQIAQNLDFQLLILYYCTGILRQIFKLEDLSPLKESYASYEQWLQNLKITQENKQSMIEDIIYEFCRISKASRHSISVVSYGPLDNALLNNG